MSVNNQSNILFLSFFFFGGKLLIIALTGKMTPDPTITESFKQVFEKFALQPSTTILPAISNKPKVKSSVEGAVRIAYRHI